MENINIDDLVTMYNEGMSLVQIGEKVGFSKTTIQRNIVQSGYVRDNETKKYIKIIPSETNSNNGTINNENNKNNNLGKRNKIEKQEKFISRTYAISEEMERAIKIKSAIEGKKPIDVVREALESYVDEKYFNM